MSERIQLRRTKGWRKPPGALVVARPSRWGNPFVVRTAPPMGDSPTVHRVLDIGDRCESLRAPNEYFTRDLYGAHVMAVRLYELHTGPMGLYEWDDPEEMLAPLRGHDLACWCPPDLPCHADVLLRLANPTPPHPTDRRTG